MSFLATHIYSTAHLNRCCEKFWGKSWKKKKKTYKGCMFSDDASWRQTWLDTTLSRQTASRPYGSEVKVCTSEMFYYSENRSASCQPPRGCIVTDVQAHLDQHLSEIRHIYLFSHPLNLFFSVQADTVTEEHHTEPLLWLLSGSF